jgi:hypothetical protein
VVVVDGVSRTAVLSEDASRAALRLLAAHVAGGRVLGEDVDACVSADEAALVVRELLRARTTGVWRVVEEFVIPLQVSRPSLDCPFSSAHSAAPASHCVQVDAFAGFELRTAARVTAVEAAAAVGRSEVAALRGAVRVLRGDVAGAGSRRLVERVAALQAENAALHAELAPLRAAAAAKAAAKAARRAAEEEAARSPPTDPASLVTAAASAFLRGKGFRAGAVPAGMTYGLATIGEAAITVKSVHPDYGKEPGIRLLYKPERPGQPQNCFFVDPAGLGIPDAWAQVDLGAPRTVLGVLTQGLGFGGQTDSAESNYCSWFTIRVQWSNDGSSWTPVAGGRTWSRTSLGLNDVMPSVFDEPVRCRYVRVEGTGAANGFLRWEVVVQRE